MNFSLHTDWSPLAIGAVLGQIDSEGQEHPIWVTVHTGGRPLGTEMADDHGAQRHVGSLGYEADGVQLGNQAPTRS